MNDPKNYKIQFYNWKIKYNLKKLMSTYNFFTNQIEPN